MTLPQVRCPQCGKRFFDGVYIMLEVRCDRCGCQSRHTCHIDNCEGLVTLITAALMADRHSLVRKNEALEAQRR